MAICVYGGSFDPPHVGHVLAAHYLLSVGLAERVVVVPVFRHALEKVLSPYDLRVEMCERAFLGDPRIVVSRIESNLPEPSYTLHTIQALAREYPGRPMRLVVGADVLSEIPRWYRFDEIEKLAPLLVLGRAGVRASDAPEVLLPEVSSTEVRSLYGSRASEEDRGRRERLIPRAVREVIEREGLYQG